MATYDVSSITGYNLSPAQTEIAKRKAAKVSARIQFLSGDAVEALRRVEVGSFTKIVSLDSAYHFRTRLNFLTEARRCLNCGRLVLIDLVLRRPLSEMTWLESVRTRAISYLAGIPQTNLWTAEEYEARLKVLQFSSYSVRVVSDNCAQDIFLPLSNHIRSSIAVYDAILSQGTKAKFRAAASLMGFLGKHQIFDVVVVSASAVEP